MRILIWGINYSPEITGIAPFNTGLCDFLVENNHTVTMVTGFPYYPFWRKLPGDGGRLFRTENIDGVKVHRCWQYVPRRSTTLKRMFHELSFGITSFVRVLLAPRPDVYIVISPPLLLGPLAAIVAWVMKRPFVFHVQDLQPDAALGLGMVKEGLFTSLLFRAEAVSYRRATLVCGISEGMLRAFARKGVPKHKRYLFPNWVRWYGRNSSIHAVEADNVALGAAFRKKIGIPSDAFLATYSGNLGRKQGLESLLEVAVKLDQRKSETGGREIVILVVGDGVLREELSSKVATAGVRSLRMLPLLPEQDYRGLLAASDVSLILQAPGTGQYFFPSKMLSILTMRSPIVGVSDESSELATAIETGGFGVNIAPGDPSELASVLLRLSADSIALTRMRAKTMWVAKYSAPDVLSDFVRRISTLQTTA